jgi:deoxycytidine triphosphate deaminase
MKHILGKNSRSTLTNVQENDSQPNACDLRLDKVFKINDENVFEISNEHKKHRGTKYELKPDYQGYFFLEPGHYEVVMENIIRVGEEEAGWVITRSTLNRNGLFLTSGLYDSGYHGSMAGVLHVMVGPARIKKGTRIGQYLSFDAESLSIYDGDYGIGKEHDKKYA